MQEISGLIDSLYKSEYRRLLAVLTRIFGGHNLHLAEDVLQESFNQALVHWKSTSVPANPSAWLIRVAKNRALDVIRANKTKTNFATDLGQQLVSEWTLNLTVEQAFSEDNIVDDQQRMIFMCCQLEQKTEYILPFVLRYLCGLSIKAIARALILEVTTVKKRLLRCKAQLKNEYFVQPDDSQLVTAMDRVHTVLYLLFNEGLHSSDDKALINPLFCQEAIGLVDLMLDMPRLANQDTFALFALMHFHIAKLDARVDAKGFGIPLNKQDRSLWHKGYLHTAQQMLALAAKMPKGATGRFYLEALIAQQHCQAINFEQTDWRQIIRLYDSLIDITDSPLARLNQAIALGYAGEVIQAISHVQALAQDKVFAKSHHVCAVLAHLHAKAGDKQMAQHYVGQSLEQGGTAHEQRLMMQQVASLLAQADSNNQQVANP